MLHFVHGGPHHERTQNRQRRVSGWMAACHLPASCDCGQDDLVIRGATLFHIVEMCSFGQHCRTTPNRACFTTTRLHIERRWAANNWLEGEVRTSAPSVSCSLLLADAASHRPLTTAHGRFPFLHFLPYDPCNLQLCDDACRAFQRSRIVCQAVSAIQPLPPWKFTDITDVLSRIKDLPEMIRTPENAYHIWSSTLPCTAKRSGMYTYSSLTTPVPRRTFQSRSRHSLDIAHLHSDQHSPAYHALESVSWKPFCCLRISISSVLFHGDTRHASLGSASE
ncbi:uncharacterized protein C8Q71DRAFT_206071 [Rhodofomes roseus]|uniref:Uncharacterized protein n=1 Tax=Rhodofomes roseus TaxID=34475 RepID=A0ABQ8KTV2_9APHY|nr:uncharacterized protein C8Q71DRAFT_206071 [Rhodofomes roseus]KAH9842507.1 hypothetical protein C8Q71DRAFT_206071 [Rhodofomes roseus]